ncbi:hypothetical protein HNQ59_000516 [Chitinivorax tropicus]|uniref:Uncharacterized protein n=1 Tax=Chitinivorax tropicus TaxID=714531 RepID=A0A840MD68_9PROT|nr:hypothetical protein [Chitinivorax tropicus]
MNTSLHIEVLLRFHFYHICNFNHFNQILYIMPPMPIDKVFISKVM